MKWIAPTLAYLAVGLGNIRLSQRLGCVAGIPCRDHRLASDRKTTHPPKNPFDKQQPKNGYSLSILLCGASGMVLYFLWDIFGFASDLSEQVASLGLNVAELVRYSSHTLPWSILWIDGIFLARLAGKQMQKPARVRLSVCRLSRADPDQAKLRQGQSSLAERTRSWAGWFWRQVARGGRQAACAGAWSHGGGFHDPDGGLQHGAIVTLRTRTPASLRHLFRVETPRLVKGYWFRVASSSPTRADVMYNSFIFFPPNTHEDTFFAGTGIRSSN
ncbi:MAG: hypothetical protein M0C28_44210 [Candidatus Moduliflexus flocculans]|nr:hypothetical protein [Candidatus Moduliflexus flocculans]